MERPWHRHARSTARHGQLGYRPEIAYLARVELRASDVIRRVDLLTGGRFIEVPTVAEICTIMALPQ